MAQRYGVVKTMAAKTVDKPVVAQPATVKPVNEHLLNHSSQPGIETKQRTHDARAHLFISEQRHSSAHN